MYGDHHQIEQVSYNLTSNAIKYALPYTTVSLDCHLDDNREFYILSNTNYAVPMTDEDAKKVFQYQGRGSNTLDRSGEGLGLYYSKIIAFNHGGELYFTQDEISQYNVPLIEEYLKMADKFKNKDLEIILKTELKRLKKEYDGLNEILGQMFVSSPFSPLYIIGNINKPTSRITFTLKLKHVKNKGELR